MARTLEKLTRPPRSAVLICGKAVMAWATRTFSRAAPRSMPHFQFSQWAQDFMPAPLQPWRSSNSRIRASSR
jgi:hypothetical protein